MFDDNYEHMRNKMMDALDTLRKVDIAQAPDYRMMVALREHFIAYGVPPSTAELMVGHMTIDVSERAVNDPELMRRVCETYGVLVGDIYAQIQKDFVHNPDQILLSMASHISIKMNF